MIKFGPMAPDGHSGPMVGPPDGMIVGPGGPPNMNGDGMDGGMKHGSPNNGPGTPHRDDVSGPGYGGGNGPPPGDYGPYGPGGPGGPGVPGDDPNDQNESAAIRKIKESMQEEAKRFEKETPDHENQFFMQ